MEQSGLPLGDDFRSRKDHGGSVRKGRRKLRRPIDPKRPLHLTIKSSRARGQWSMLRAANERLIRELVHSYARKNHIRVFRYANVGNHLHILIQAKHRPGFQRFLKTITSLIPRLVTGARKGNPIGKFWDALAHSRIVNWGRDFTSARFYVIQNEVEASGPEIVDERSIRPKPG